jgi:hypothetical protein
MDVLFSQLGEEQMGRPASEIFLLLLRHNVSYHPLRETFLFLTLNLLGKAAS